VYDLQNKEQEGAWRVNEGLGERVQSNSLRVDNFEIQIVHCQCVFDSVRLCVCACVCVCLCAVSSECVSVPEHSGEDCGLLLSLHRLQTQQTGLHLPLQTWYDMYRERERGAE
jgi:hypothetical protein